MKALVFGGAGEMVIEERPAPEPRAGQVRVRVVASGICGSELEAYSGRSRKRRPGLVFGHELVVSVGEELFVVDPLTTCGSCRLCRNGDTNLCPDRQLLSLHLDGGNQEYLVVAESHLLPWAGDPVLGTLVEPGGTVLRALSGIPDLTGERVGVFGCGAIGLLAVLFARRLGAAEVVAFDPLPNRLELAVSLGATPLDPDGPVLDCVLVLDTVGAAASRSAAIRHTAPGGEVGLVGLRDPVSEVDFSDVISRGIRLRGWYSFTRESILRAGELLLDEPEAGRLLHTMPFDEGALAFSKALNSPEDFIKIVLTFDEEGPGD